MRGVSGFDIQHFQLQLKAFVRWRISDKKFRSRFLFICELPSIDDVTAGMLFSTPRIIMPQMPRLDHHADALRLIGFWIARNFAWSGAPEFAAREKASMRRGILLRPSLFRSVCSHVHLAEKRQQVVSHRLNISMSFTITISS